jgi:ADP-ribosyl-[dinitrogen reductase] hydrolase
LTPQNTPDHDRFRGCLLGLAAGDAVGTTAEFHPRGSFPPITGMKGGGPFALNPGEWTDDTSMALCLAHSLLEVGGFDAADQMRRYSDWQERGYMSSNGRCFDIGNTVSRSLEHFRRTGDPFSGSTDPRTAGNGSIMRLAPVPMALHDQPELLDQWCADSSRTTHAAAECLEACVLLGRMLQRALSGCGKQEILFSEPSQDFSQDSIRILAEGHYRAYSIEEIRGSGYVVRSLEAALWCFWTTDSFEEAILTAANLGEDADTTAAVCGQLAGAHYGERNIPDQWLRGLVQRHAIASLADRLLALPLKASPIPDILMNTDFSAQEKFHGRH